MAQGGAQRSCLFVCLLLAWVQACYWRAGLLTPSGPKRKQLCEPPSQPAASPACPPASCPAAGFMIVREGEPVFMSPQQQHEFNFPFQIGSADSRSDLPQVRTGRGAWRCLACHAPASQRTGRVPGVPGLLCEGWIPAGSIRLPPASCRPISSLLRLPSSHYLPPFPPLPIHTYTHRLPSVLALMCGRATSLWWPQTACLTMSTQMRPQPWCPPPRWVAGCACCLFVQLFGGTEWGWAC